MNRDHKPHEPRQNRSVNLFLGSTVFVFLSFFQKMQAAPKTSKFYPVLSLECFPIYVLVQRGAKFSCRWSKNTSKEELSKLVLKVCIWSLWCKNCVSQTLQFFTANKKLNKQKIQLLTSLYLVKEQSFLFIINGKKKIRQ